MCYAKKEPKRKKKKTDNDKKKDEDHDGPISLTWAYRFAYLKVNIETSYN